MSPIVIRDQFVPVADSVPEARHLLDDFEGLVSSEKLDQLKLLVSELVANSVVHAGLTEDHEVGLYVSLEEPFISVEVRDGGIGFEKPRFLEEPGLNATGGRGLYIVESLVEFWGVNRVEGDTVVWFELSC